MALSPVALPDIHALEQGRVAIVTTLSITSSMILVVLMPCPAVWLSGTTGTSLGASHWAHKHFCEFAPLHQPGSILEAGLVSKGRLNLNHEAYFEHQASRPARCRSSLA